MTQRERVMKAIAHQETDFLPYQIIFTGAAREKVAAALGDPDFEEKIGNHIERASYEGFPTPVPDRPGYYRDQFGVLWNRNGRDKDVGMIEGIVIDSPDLASYGFPAIRGDELQRLFQEMMHNGKDCFKLCRIGGVLFERAWSLRGYENFLMDLALEPDFAVQLLAEICEFDLQVIEIALTCNVDGFYFGDDWGQQTGLILGPANWRKYLKPALARLYERIKSAGKCIVQHSCGDNREIMPDLIEMGVDVYQTLQPEIYDIAVMKKEYGKDITFWGGISSQQLLPHGTPAEVRETVIRTMKILGKNGGYIAGPAHWITGDVPVENILALLDVFQNQSKYL